MIETAEEFVRLRSSDEAALYSRAASETAPEHVWQQVIQQYPEMRKWVVHNKTVPHKILAELAADDDPSVRHAVAIKRKLEQSILEQLANDVDESVRLAVALNPKTPQNILEKLANDPWERISEVARQRIDSESRQR